MLRDAKIIATVACNMKSCREAKGLSKRELAKKTGITEVTIGRYENMKRVPDALAIYKIAECLGISVADLYK